MARTKKEMTGQDPMEEQALNTLPPPEDMPPHTGSDGDQEAGATGSLSDMELAGANSLNPDAPQTESEMQPGEAPLQAGDGPSPAPGSGQMDTPPPQTGFSPEAGTADSGGDLHTGFETGENGQLPADGPFSGESPFEGVGFPGAMSPPFYMSPEETGPAAQSGGSPPEEPAVPPQDAAGSGQEQAETGRAKLRMPRRRGPRVVSIDAERTVETESDKLRSDLLDLVESMKGRKILTGTIQGVERLASNPEMCYAVIYHGDFKVIIPVLDAIEEPEDYRGQPKGDVLHYLLNKRLGAEVDYVVNRIDPEGGVVAASRLEAMALKRREYYFRTDRDGNYQIYEGIRAEARVVSVIRAGIFVDLFGAECYIPLRELSYQRWVDAASHYQPGQRVLVKVLDVDRSDRSKPRVAASVKQASENPYEKALKKYAVGNRYVGTVSMVDLSGVFVSLDGGIDCLCTHPKRGRPPRGARVTVRILGINNENNRIWGVITHMSTTR